MEVVATEGYIRVVLLSGEYCELPFNGKCHIGMLQAQVASLLCIEESFQKLIFNQKHLKVFYISLLFLLTPLLIH